MRLSREARSVLQGGRGVVRWKLKRPRRLRARRSRLLESQRKHRLLHALSTSRRVKFINRLDGRVMGYIEVKPLFKRTIIIDLFHRRSYAML
jgi:hypothetical protein